MPIKTPFFKILLLISRLNLLKVFVRRIGFELIRTVGLRFLKWNRSEQVNLFYDEKKEEEERIKKKKDESKQTTRKLREKNDRRYIFALAPAILSTQ